MSYLLSYIDEIESGRIIAGEELKSVLNGLKNDLNNPSYIYDETPGKLRIDFIEKFCKHTKSPFNGQPFILELWEKALLECAYGFKMADTGLRRFNEVILLIARKNGKTTFIAGIDLAEFFLSRGGTDIVCASNTNDQASILFEEINNMREQSKALRNEKRSKKNIFYIYSPKNKNKIKKLSAQSRNKDGYNIEVGCIDEVHEMTDSKVYDAIKQSQSTKKEPLIFIITTEGTTVDGFLDSKLEYCRKMIKGEIKDIRILPWLYTQDGVDEIFSDPTSWTKSNPSLGNIKLRSYLEDMMVKSQNDLSTRVTMLCKDFNIKQLDSGSWLTFNDLNNETRFKLEELRDSYAIGGVDLSSTTDLTAAVLLVIKNGKKYVIPHFFMPGDLIEQRVKEDKIPYDLWIKKGLVSVTNGNQNDFSLVTQWFLLMVRNYGIRPLWIGYDPWNSQYWVKEMEDAGFTMLKWCFSNTQAKIDINGNIQPSKLNSKLRRIDGCVALIIAYAVLNRYKNDYENMIS